MPRLRRHAILFLGAMLILGCRAQPRETVPTRASRNETLEQKREGLEVIWWITDDTRGQVAGALARYAEPPLPADERLRERWSTSGLRLVSAPVEALANITADLPPDARRFNQPIGWATSWTEVFRGRRLGDAPVVIMGVARRPPPGVVRLLVRNWPMPAASTNAPATMRIEVAFQSESASRDSLADPFDAPALHPEEQRGELIRELTLQFAADASRAFIITCEAPDQPWSPDRTDSESGESGFSPPPDLESADRERAERDARPPATFPSFGQAMLSSTTQGPDPRASKAIIVLLPRLPDRVTLLP